LPNPTGVKLAGSMNFRLDAAVRPHAVAANPWERPA
jgi:hypothetical protein